MESFETRLKNFLLTLGIIPNNLDIYILSLTHRSKSKNNNEKLEFLGDAVLELVISYKLFEDFFNTKTEGELTSLRAALVKTESLAKESLRIGLNNYIILSKSEENTGGREKNIILADTFEAFLGAIYIDQGLEKVKEFIVKNLYYKINLIIQYSLNVDSKTKLQEIIQNKYKITPIYKLISSKGPDHNKTFKVVAIIGSKKFALGTGKTKQAAEQKAALKTIKILEKKNWKI